MAEALYLRPNPTDGGTRYVIGTVHPDWHLEHERVGDLVLIAKPGFQIVDGSSEEFHLIGNHGGPGDREVPVIVLGGAPIGLGESCDRITAADLGRTVQSCLGLPEVSRLDGRPIARSDRGRVLAGICTTQALRAPAEPVTGP
jgi:hypothetical protein